MPPYTLHTVNPALAAAATAPVHSVTFRLWVDWAGTGLFTDESAYVLDMTGIESADAQTRYLGASEATIVLDNTAGRYTPTNAASPLYAYLSHGGQKAYIELGYNGLVTRVNTYWVESLLPRVMDQTATMRMLDRVGQMANTVVSAGPNGGVSFDVPFGDLCSAAGLATGEYAADVGTRTCPYYIASGAQVISELMQVAQAEGGRIFADSTGVLTFWNADHVAAAQRSPLITLTRSKHLYDIGFPQRSGQAVTRFVLEYDTRQNVSVDEVVYSQVQPITLPAATLNATSGYITFAAPVVLQVEAMDMVRWERNFPVQFTTVNTIAGKTRRDGSGVALTAYAYQAPQNNTLPPGNNLYYVWYPGGRFGTIYLWTDNTAGAQVQTLTINGKPQRSVSPYSVIADLPGATKVVEQRMKNAYLPSTDLAMEQAKTELLYRSGQMSTVDVPALDGMPFLRAFEVFAVIDDSVTPNVTYFLQVLRNEWKVNASEGFRCAITSAGSTPANEQVVVVTVPVPAVAAPTTRTPQSPPWYWGIGSSQDLVWTFSDWM